MASEYVGPSITDLPGWRVGLLFLLFAAIAFLWHRGLQALDLYLKRKGKRGLRKVLRALKEEVLILGVISLVLIAFERYLLRICLPCSGDSCYWQAEGSEAEPQEEAVVVETCGPGSEPMWAPAAIIQAHALLFTIAAVHILYTTVVMLLCLWKMGRWRRFEEHSKAKWLDPIKYSALPTPGGNPMVHFLRCLVKMFTQSVDANAYHALRRLFVERMDVDPGFDFLGFLVESMEEELASIISISFILWAVAIVWIMLPPESWVMVWMGGLAAVALLVVGVKLESIICQLTVHAYRRYGRQDSKSPALEGTIVKALRQSLTKISPFRRSSSPWDCASAQACTNDLEMGFENTPAALVPQEHAQRSTVQRQEAGEQLPGQNRLGFGVGTSAYESAAGASVAPLETLQPTAPDVKQQRPPRQQYMLHGDQPPPVISGMEMEAAQANGQDFIIGIVTDGAECSTNGKDSSQQLEVPDRNPGGSGQPTGAFRRCLNELLAPCSMSAFECWRWPQRLQKRGGGGLAAADGGAAGQGSTPSAMDGGLDSASLFWFGRPRVMLYVIQVIYFENSLALAAFLFSLWQGVDFDWGRGRKSQWYIIVPLLILDLALLVFSALFVLPVYAISTAAGSHCPESVIKHALKNPRLAPCARAVQRLSMDPALWPPPGPAGEQPSGGFLRGNVETDATPSAASSTSSFSHLPSVQQGSTGAWARSPCPACGDMGTGQASISDPEQLASSLNFVELAGTGEDDDSNKSVTRLLGAMLASKSRQYLERVSGGSSCPGSPHPSRRLQQREVWHSGSGWCAWHARSQRATCSLPEEAGLRLLRQWQQAAPMRGEQQAAAAECNAQPRISPHQVSATSRRPALLESRPSLSHVRDLFSSLDRNSACEVMTATTTGDAAVISSTGANEAPPVPEDVASWLRSPGTLAVASSREPLCREPTLSISAKGALWPASHMQPRPLLRGLRGQPHTPPLEAAREDLTDTHFTF